MKNFLQVINDDVAALESLFFQETNNYHNSATLQGKAWYAVALEDIDSNKQKDTGNKQGIIRRMITAVRDFIARMITRIKAFFTGGKKVDPKVQEDFSKNYQGPSNESMGKASGKEGKSKSGEVDSNLKKFVDRYVQKPEPDDPESLTPPLDLARTALRMLVDGRISDRGYITTSMKYALEKIPNIFEDYEVKAFAREIDENSDNWDDTYRGTQFVYLDTNFSKKRFMHLVDVLEYLKNPPAKTTARPKQETPQSKQAAPESSFSSAAKELQKEWAEAAVARLGTDAKIIVVAMLDKDFAQDLKFLADKANRFLTSTLTTGTIDDAAQNSKRLRETADSCVGIIEEVRKESDEQHSAEVVGVFISPDKTKAALLTPYHGYSKDVELVNKFLENLKKISDQLEKEDQSEETLAKVKKVQQLTSDVTVFISLFTKVALAYDKLMDVLK